MNLLKDDKAKNEVNVGMTSNRDVWQNYIERIYSKMMMMKAN